MDPERVRAYLQVACAGLGFDIGEVWYTSNESGSSTVAQIESNTSNDTHEAHDAVASVYPTAKPKKKIKFLQLYTSKSFDDRRSELVLPPSERRRLEAERADFLAKTKANGNNVDGGGTCSISSNSMDMDGFKPLARGNSILSPAELEKHVLSPRMVDAISESAEVVWANCSESGGLIGRSDMRLQTAVGMPVAIDDEGNMCIVVMFSPENVQSSDDAVEYLQAIGKSAVSSSIPCLLPVIEENNRLMGIPSAGNSIGGCSADTDVSSASSRDNGIDHRGVSPSHHYPQHHNRSEPRKDFGHGVKARFVSLDESGDDEAEIHNTHEVTSAPKDCYGIPMLPTFAELGSSLAEDVFDEAASAFDDASYGVWSTVMEGSSDSAVATAAAVAAMASGSTTKYQSGFMGLSPSKISAGDTPRDAINTLATNSSRTTSSSRLVLGKPTMLDRRRNRLEEFLSAFLGMSVFDLADVWMPIGEDFDALTHVTSVTTTDNNERLSYFKRVSESSTIRTWSGAVGRAFGSGNPVWTTNKAVYVDSDRASAFEYANILTALAIPVHSAGTVAPSCVICCYSLVRAVSVNFVLKFVQQALRLLWEGLDRVEPHKSVGRLWNDVAPADLGEMAADIEMQKAFLSKKRPHDAITSQRSGAFVGGATESGHGRKSSLALQLEALQVPEEEAPPAPEAGLASPLSQCIVGLAPAPMLPSQVIAPDDRSSLDIQQQEERVLAMKTQVQEAVRSIDNAVLWSSHQAVATNDAGTKRAHISPFDSLGPSSSTPSQPLAYASSPLHYQSGLPQPYSTLPPPPDAVPSVTYNNSTMGPPAKEDRQMAIDNIRTFNAMAQQAATGAQSTLINLHTTPGPLPDPSSCLSSIDQASHPGNGSKQCRIQGCHNFAVARRPYCTKHSGNRLCEREGCTKCAQGSTRFCIAHGGGRRCTFPGCDKGARDKFFCAAHGGGKRCSHKGCSRSAVGGSNLCTSHGGGKRCAVAGCGKSAQSSTKFCVKHGGGKKCAYAGGCSKVARGRTLYCAAHGGGIRCKLEGCNRVAIGKLQLCRAHGGGSRSKSNGSSHLSASDTR